ncbi:MAG: hypothetical protein HYT46_01970 [Candidatus Vogelbacteria bacterium]|nr:hypothetical protein [Candidatus Vogelbacteria bacterium]
MRKNITSLVVSGILLITLLATNSAGAQRDPGVPKPGDETSTTTPTSNFGYPTGVPRCQITQPDIYTSGSPILAYPYPYPANHDSEVYEQVNLPPGQTEEPTELPIKGVTLRWAAMMDKTDVRYEYNLLTAEQGYTAELSSNASGNSSSVQPIRQQSIPLSGTLGVKIKTEPIRFTITIKKNGAAVASCSANVTHRVGWIEIFKPPETAKKTKNPLFPYSVKDITGKDYLNRLPPTPADYSSPVKRFVGRYYDTSGSPGCYQDLTIGFYWPCMANFLGVRETPTKLLIPLSASLVGYSKSTFISRLTEPLLFFKLTLRGYFMDALIPWDTVFNHLDPKNGVMVPFADSRYTIANVEVDDRGYIYYTHATGLGPVIVRDDGRNLLGVTQIVDPERVPAPGQAYATMSRTANPRGIKIVGVSGGVDGRGLRVYRSGNNYYLFQRQVVINVTDPYNPTLYRSNFSGDLGLQAGEIIAAQTGRLASGNLYLETPQAGAIKIYSSVNFVSGLAPQKEFAAPAGGYHGLATDQATGRFFSIGYDAKPEIRNIKGVAARYVLPKAFLSVFAPGAGSGAESYTETRYELNLGGQSGNGKSDFSSIQPFIPTSLSYQKGYLIAQGRDPGGLLSGRIDNNIRLWIFRNGQPEELENIHTFIKNFYVSPNQGQQHADENGERISPSPVRSVSVHAFSGTDYLFVTTNKYGDVFELEPLSQTTTATTTQTTTPTIAGCLPGYIYSYLTGVRCDGTGGQGTFGSNVAPSIGSAVSGPTALAVGQQGTWTITARDGNRDDISWSVDWGSGRSTHTCEVNPGAGTSQNSSYVISHSWVTPGTKTVKVYADDCKGGTTEKTFTVSVSGTGGTGSGDGGDELNQNAN